MKLLACFALFFTVASVMARPDGIDLDLDDISHHQDSTEDGVAGSYSFVAPDGVQYFVKYVADSLGFRIVESNAVPVSVGGVKADGNQGSFTSDESDELF